MLIVMINGWTRKTPTPIPFTRPTTAAGTSAMSDAGSQPTSDTSVAMTYAVIDATTATERSMPPVSIVRVWQAAMIARGIANRIVLDTHVAVTIPGCTIWRTRTSSDSKPRGDECRSTHPRRATASVDRSAGGGHTVGQPSPPQRHEAPSMTRPP